MPGHIVIDGNNLLHAAHAQAPIPNPGRETLVRIIEDWASRRDDDVTLVFDGPAPDGGLGRQLTSKRITVRFSAPLTADDVIVELVARCKDPGVVRVVSADTAIIREARYRRCQCTAPAAFLSELFPAAPRESTPKPTPPAGEKPTFVSADERKRWLETFGIDDEEEPFEGYDRLVR